MLQEGVREEEVRRCVGDGVRSSLSVCGVNSDSAAFHSKSGAADLCGRRHNVKIDLQLLSQSSVVFVDMCM